MTEKHVHLQLADSGLKKGSISLTGAVVMGTGVMIGVGIFALTGQIAELAGPWFPLSFLFGAIVTAFSAYTYITMSNAWPSSGGIAMILVKAYGPGAVAAAASLLMALSMVINESLVARTFATYALRPFDIENGPLVSVIGVGLIIFAYLVNASGNRSVGLLSVLMSALKIGGIALAMVATASGLIASVFAVSRMLAMLTDMTMIPHSHFGMSGTIQSHALVYTVVIAGALTVLFNLSRIASLGAFFYLVMDMLVHWGVWRRLRHEIGARGSILLTALALDAVVLMAFASIKSRSDPAILWIAAGGIALVFAYGRMFLKRWLAESKS